MENVKMPSKEGAPKIGIREICNAFNERLKLILNGTNDNYAPLELGNPCKALINCGVPDIPIQMAVQRLVDKKLQSNHPFSLVSVVHMPDYLAEPIAVFQSKTRTDCKVILTEMEEKGKRNKYGCCNRNEEAMRKTGGQ